MGVGWPDAAAGRPDPHPVIRFAAGIFTLWIDDSQSDD
jgi:hypothetical protein